MLTWQASSIAPPCVVIVSSADVRLRTSAAPYAEDMDRMSPRQTTSPLVGRERWTNTLGYALAMFAAYLLAPMSFMAAFAASSAMTCMYLAVVAWRRRNAFQDAECAIAGAGPEAGDAPEPWSFRRDSPHIFVH